MSNDQLYLLPVHIDGAQRATSPRELIRFCWEATAQSQLRPFQVEFEWRVNGTLVTTEVQKEQQQRIVSPRYSPGEPRMPGAPRGRRTPLNCFVAQMQASALPPGLVSVTATIRSGSFSYTYPVPMRAFNHRDGTAMPCSAVIYVDTVAGNDTTGTGLSWASPFRTINKALATMRRGTTFADRDLAGGRIFVRGTVTGWTDGDWHTSAPGWLDIVADSGANLNVAASPAYNPATDRMAFGATAVGGQARVHLVGFDIVGGSPVVGGSSGVPWHCWVDNCTNHSAYYNGGYSVRWLDDAGTLFPFEGTDGSRYYTGHRSYAVRSGLERYVLAHDCIVESFLGVALYHLDTTTSHTVDCAVAKQSYLPGVVRGYIRQEGVSLRASVPVPGILAIEGPSGVNFLSDALELVPGDVPNSYWGLRVDGFSSPGVNGTRRVLAAGVWDNRTYVLFSAPGVTMSSSETVVGSLYTASVRESLGTAYWVSIHPDGVFMRGDRTRDRVKVRMWDYDGMQVIFGEGQGANDDKNSCWIEVAAAGPSGAVAHMFECNLRNSLFRNCAITSQLQISSNRDHTGCAIENSVMGTLGGFGFSQPAAHAALLACGLQMRNCHIESGVAVGVSTSVGSAWSQDPAVAPWHFVPRPVLVGTGLPGSYEPQHWAPSLSASSKGPLRNVATLNWDAPLDLPADGSRAG